MKNFRNQVAAYLSSAPVIDFNGTTKYVLLDSVRTARSLFSETYQISYYLTDDPLPVNFFTIEAKQHSLRSSSDERPAGPLFTGGFNSRLGFQEAQKIFEQTAREVFYLDVK
jgi:hypothetical protein